MAKYLKQAQTMVNKLNPMTKCMTGLQSRFAVVCGAQWGDEGKGKLVDIICPGFNMCGRFNGGANAGHTVVAEGVTYKFHLLPSGMLHDGCVNVIGNGCVVDMEEMFEEMQPLRDNGVEFDDRFYVSDRAQMVTKGLKMADAKFEDDQKRFIGTTQKGIGPTYAAKMNRVGLRFGNLKNWSTFKDRYMYLYNQLNREKGIKYDYKKELRTFKKLGQVMMDKGWIVDTVSLVNNAMKDPKTRFLAEGANGLMLDIDYGTYPYVTSSHPGVAGINSGLGLPVQNLETCLAVVKAYTTRVGEGPFPTELLGSTGEKIREVGHEYGATTGRPRRCGWLDVQQMKYSHMLNSYTSINLTKLDVLSHLENIKVGMHYTINGEKVDGMPSTLQEVGDIKVHYETLPGWQEDIMSVQNWDDLPENAQKYVEFVEEAIGVPVSWIGTGPERESMILRE